MCKRSGIETLGSILSMFPFVALMIAPVLAEEGPIALDAVSVTAKGYESGVLDTPASIMIIDREEIRRRNPDNLGEAVRGRPGLAATSDSAHGQNPVIRGLKKESVVLLVDGMRLNSAQPAGAIASFMSLDLAERVEVVKGPASVLYGTGALGGAINVLLPQARFLPGHDFAASAAYESANQGLRGTGVMNASQDHHAVMLGVSLARIDDYDSPGGRVPRTGYDSDAYIGQYRYRLDEAQQLRFSLQQQEDRDIWFPGSSKPHPHPLIDQSVIHSPQTRRRLVEVGYGFEGEGERPLNLDLRLYRQELQRRIFSFVEPQDFNLAETEVSFDSDGLDVRADWLAHPAHLISVGANAWRMEASPERDLRDMTNPPDFPFARNDPFQDGRIEALGFYVQDDMLFGDLNVLAGLRYDQVEGDASAVGNPRVTTGLDSRDSAISGNLGASYRVSPLLRPYASLSRGFRAGDMRERFESSPRGDGFFHVGNPRIEPEIAHQVEIGVKGADGALSYNLSAYYNRINDYITGQPTNQIMSGRPVKRTVNLGSVTITGLEAELHWQALPGHWLSLGYSRLRGENDDLDEPLYQMPADEVSLGWNGRLYAGWTADAVLRLVRRQDRVATTFSNATEDPTPGFTTLDVGVTWEYAREQSLRLAVTNLNDKRYHEHLTEGISGDEIKQPGRNFHLIWKGSF
ncbi:TonB-dependent heme/hemoglobin receptor family protein [Thiohalobacter sp. COW1]|uniref:TonB-dependent receptor n=1 Tax=Thiohalobacter sp. COW1 TaxID=2795687 RepID=UPI00191553BB|nr:TonB-dependent receptor [Thiohalobacter sp. COW1]BCO31414.1 TonB-dependent heme/hemoglobin receptor family protein [Thiohalobacter sp. COW1]